MHAAFAAYMPVIHYVLNYNFYKEVLCENKAKPELVCNGKCHLAKEIKAAKQQNEDSKLPVPELDLSKRPISTFEKTFSFQIADFEMLFKHHHTHKNVINTPVYIGITTPPPIDII